MEPQTAGTKTVKKVLEQCFKEEKLEHSNLYITIAGTIGSVGDVSKSFNGMNLTENAAKFVFSNKKTR